MIASTRLDIRPAILAAVLALPLQPTPATAQIPFRVSEIATATNPDGSDPTDGVAAQSLLYFEACDAPHGCELWRTDATSAGTLLLRDLVPGHEGSDPRHGAPHGGSLFFSLPSASGYLELWRSDGSPAGTGPVALEEAMPENASAEPGCGTSDAFYFTLGSVNETSLWRFAGGVGSPVPSAEEAEPIAPLHFACTGARVYFTAGDPDHGRELWTVAHAGAAAERVVDLVAGPDSAFPHGIPEPAVLGSTLYFVATDGVHELELWKSNGTAAGTSRLSDLPDAVSVPIERLTTSGSTLFFLATTPAAGRELWKSSGTMATTAIVADLAPGINPSIFGGMAAFQGGLLFEADDVLYWSDGTAGGTDPVADADPTRSFASAGVLGAKGSIAYLVAQTSPGKGAELWKATGSPPQAVFVKDIRVGEESSEPRALGFVGTTFLFSAVDGSTGRELWKSAGGAASTVRVADLRGGTGSIGLPLERTSAAIGDRLYLTLDDGVHGPEVWHTDGSTTALLAEVGPGSNDDGPEQLTAADDRLFFRYYGEVWRSDGTAAGTSMIQDASDSPYCETDLLAGATELLFTECVGSELPLFRADAGPEVAQIEAGSVRARHLRRAGATVFFEGYDATAGKELWATDGTPGDAARLADIRPGTTSSELRDLTPVGDLVYFTAIDGVHGRELWRSDGTPGGTELAVDLIAGGWGSEPTALVAAGDRLFFAAAPDGTTPTLYGLDSTTDEVTLLRAAPGGLGQIFTAGDLAFVVELAEEAPFNRLWRSDGTAEGTFVILASEQIWLDARHFASLGGIAYFVHRDETSGAELWRSDGSVEGTHRIGEVVPGSGDGAPDDLASAGGELYFTADDGLAGREIWSLRTPMFADGFESGDACGWDLVDGASPGCS